MKLARCQDRQTQTGRTVDSTAITRSGHQSDACVGVSSCCLTFRQGQQGDGGAQPPTTQADQMGALCLELQPLPGLDQVQRGALQRRSHMRQSVSVNIVHYCVFVSCNAGIWQIFNSQQQQNMEEYRRIKIKTLCV